MLKDCLLKQGQLMLGVGSGEGKTLVIMSCNALELV
jgi:hypothetical protein